MEAIANQVLLRTYVYCWYVHINSSIQIGLVVWYGMVILVTALAVLSGANGEYHEEEGLLSDQNQVGNASPHSQTALEVGWTH